MTDIAQIMDRIPDNGVFYFQPQISGDTQGDGTQDEAVQAEIVISCGIHGNETAPIELCLELVDEIRQQQWRPTQRVMILFGNLPAISAGQRFMDENLNRLFSGAHRKGQTPEHRRAAEIEQLITDFYHQRAEGTAQPRQRYHYDLHTAIRDSCHEKFAVYPFTHGEPLSAQQLNFLAESGVDTVLLAHQPTHTLSYYSAHRHGAHAFTVELGKVRPFGANDLSRLAALKRNLIALMQGQGGESGRWQHSSTPRRLFQATREIPRQTEQFSFSFPDDTPNFTVLPPGALLARDGETEYHTEYEGEAIVFPNAKVQPGHRAVLMVRPVDESELAVC